MTRALLNYSNLILPVCCAREQRQVLSVVFLWFCRLLAFLSFVLIASTCPFREGSAIAVAISSPCVDDQVLLP